LHGIKKRKQNGNVEKLRQDRHEQKLHGMPTKASHLEKPAARSWQCRPGGLKKYKKIYMFLIFIFFQIINKHNSSCTLHTSMYEYTFKKHTASAKPKSQITEYPTKRGSKYFYKKYFCDAIAYKKPLKIFYHNNDISKLPLTDQIAITQHRTSARIKPTEKLQKPIQANAKAGKVIRNNPHKNFAAHRNTIKSKCHPLCFSRFFPADRETVVRSPPQPLAIACATTYSKRQQAN